MDLIGDILTFHQSLVQDCALRLLTIHHLDGKGADRTITQPLRQLLLRANAKPVNLHEQYVIINNHWDVGSGRISDMVHQQGGILFIGLNV